MVFKTPCAKCGRLYKTIIADYQGLCVECEEMGKMKIKNRLGESCITLNNINSNIIHDKVTKENLVEHIVYLLEVKKNIGNQIREFLKVI